MKARHPMEAYSRRCEAFTAERDRLGSVAGRLTHMRTITFLAVLLCLFGAWDVGGALRWLVLGTGLLLMAAFIWLVAAHSRTKRRLLLEDTLRKVNEDAKERLQRNWSELGECDYAAPPNHPYAADLDLFGHASLFQLLGTAATIPGRKALYDWLLSPADRSTILQRQEAVAELAPLLDYRHNLEARGRLVGRERPRALHAFIDWVKGDRWILDKPYLIWSTRTLPVITLVSLTLHVAGVLTVPIWAVSIGTGVIITFRTYAKIHSVFGLVATGDLGLRSYSEVFEAATAERFESRLLTDLLGKMAPAAGHMRQLDRILAHAEVRYSSMLHGILQLLLMWDHNVMTRLEKWRRAAGPEVEEWIDALGQLEALAALAAVSHAHPDWTYPDIAEDDAPPVLEAKGLGHPLLPSDECVVNDVEVGPPGTFLFVTGSNMSGKSTLLRSIGVNAVLAQAGGPVYAKEMRLPLVCLYTSMRISDSLEQGISQYMAQLARLKMIVDGARRANEADSRRQALFLLDEILQGTNSAERLVAVRRIIRRLLDFRAIGALTSHELTVPDDPGLSDAAHIVHFRETATQEPEGVTLSFDYILRPGPSTSTNALKLMEMVGLR